MAKNSLSQPIRIIQVAVPVPLSGLFDYRVPEGFELPQIGCRVKVPFGRRSLVAIVCRHIEASEHPLEKLRDIDEILDEQPILPADLLELAEKASRYYHHPLGEVFATLLPNALCQGKALDAAVEPLWQLSETGKNTEPETLKRAPKQQALLSYFQEQQSSLDADMPARDGGNAGSAGATASELNCAFQQWRPALKVLLEKGLIIERSLPSAPKLSLGPELAVNKEQALAINTVRESKGFQSFLLQGITGSGKTEVYLQLIADCLRRGQQALVLVPEIGLTPQLVERFEQRFSTLIVSLHSNMTDLERLRAWHLAAEGLAQIVIGTRSALFTALPRLGMIVVDEEHDSSFKQQDSFRYHARDLAVMRAKMLDIPIIMGSATPSMESLFNIRQGRYTRLELTERAGGALPPRIAVIDSRVERGLNYEHALCAQLRGAIAQHLEQGNQVLLFLNRRGYAPMLSCPGCGWHAQCQRCDASMTLHQRPPRLCCHHCTAERRPENSCPNCGYSELDTVGLGTEKLEQELQQHFPAYQTIRIDRDSTRRKGALAEQLGKIQRGEAQILLGTQMLAKGHHFPKVTLVGILDCDRGLFSADFRGTEQMAQLILQVAGRAGREKLAGHVMIQSSQPDHPLLHSLITQGYNTFSKACLDERKIALLPPYSHQALLRAESVQQAQAISFLQGISEQLPQHKDVMVLGPIPAPMERRAGRFRAQLLLQSQNRAALHQLISALRYSCEQSKHSRTVRWSLDVDPTDMF